MDPFSRSWYRSQFEIRFLRLRGDAFQDFFGDVMSRRFPTQFIRTRPWGNTGDRKNDGYHRGDRELFQVYAPDELTAKEAISKIEEDFDSALPYWKDYFDRWTFVHNAARGLGPDVVACLLRLDGANPNINVGHWGFEALERQVMLLTPEELDAIFGTSPDSRSFGSVRSEDLLVVLDHLAQNQDLTDVDIRPVSMTKLQKNALGVDSKVYLQMGKHKSGQVREMFDKFPDPLTGERIAQGFRDRYAELGLQDLQPDTVLSELIAYAEGYGNYQVLVQDRQRHHAAVAAVIAYLFERCDIFEDPDEECDA